MRSTYAQIALYSILILFSCARQSYSNDDTLYLLTRDRGVVKSTNNGRTWHDYNRGLPKKFEPVRIYSAGEYLFLSTYESGLFRCKVSENLWEPANTPDFHLRSIYYPNTKYRKITALASDSATPSTIVAATKHAMYKSFDRGKNWTRIKNRGMDSRNYITALSLFRGTVTAGTSYNGIYVLKGDTWIRKTSGLPKESYSQENSFVEQISALFQYGDTLYAGTEFGKGLFKSSLNESVWSGAGISIPQASFESVHDIRIANGNLFVAAGNRCYVIDKSTGLVSHFVLNEYIRSVPSDSSPTGLLVAGDDIHRPSLFFHIESPGKISKVSSSKRAIYASVPLIRRNLNGVIQSIKRCGFNAVVIDMKDDSGDLYYPTKNKTAVEIGALRKPLNVVPLLERLHENGIYAIARVVVFKDKRLYNGYNNKYAIRNRTTNLPWRGTENEYWVDPHSNFVQRYSIEIAQELQNFGFDEIQFDYIRFPSDGAVHLCSFPFRIDSDMFKSEILTDFLMKCKESLHVPISTDIYGFNSWYHFGNSIGQDMEAFSRIVDVICPMVYPSHFGPRFYSWEPHESRPYRIVHDGGIRGRRLVGDSVVIRPYLQAFNMMSPTWGPGYIRRQVEGAEKSGCSGFTFWNARGEYGTVEQAFR